MSASENYDSMFRLQQQAAMHRRDAEVLRKEKATLQTRVRQQRHELAQLTRAYWKVCRVAELRGRALSLVKPLLRALLRASEQDLRHLQRFRADEVAPTGWLPALASAELDRRQHWHWVGTDPAEVPVSPTDAPTLEQTG